jgi:hypothetical protein
MKVRITAFITAEDGSYAYYPGQVLVDHAHGAEWIARGQAVEVTEKAVAPKGKTAVTPAGEVSKPAGEQKRKS